MLKFVFSLTMLIPSLFWGQGSLIFFSESGERFTLTVNGQTVNYQPDTRVRFDGVNTEGVKVNIKFEQAELGSIIKTVLASPTLEITYNLKRNKKNEWVVRYLSEAPAGTTAPVAPVAQPVYHDEPVVPAQQQTPSNTNPNNGSVGFQFNVNEQNGSVGIQMNVDGVQTNTTISGSHTLNSNIDHEHETWQSSQWEGNGQTRYEMATAQQKCIVGMWDTELRKGIQTIQSHTSDEERLASAKQMADSYCFYIGQVKQIINLFTYDETKLAFAIYAYSKVASTDIKEYYTLSSLFTYGGTKTQFDEFLKSAKK
ncbi:MAG: DUF4476 domain-containing protein [Bacteroidetes bacterium]|nr:DUF4476 domain-containing protein [Bacteroidota bacterium]